MLIPSLDRSISMSKKGAIKSAIAKSPKRLESRAESAQSDSAPGEPLYCCNDCGFIARANPTAERYPKQDDCLRCCSPSLFDMRTPSMLARKPSNDGHSDSDNNPNDDD